MSKTNVFGIENIARALGIKPHLAVELLHTFDISLRGGLADQQIDDLRSVLVLFIAEREREKNQADHERRIMRVGRTKLIRAVGEGRASVGTIRDVKKELAEERRLRKAQAKNRKCLRCGRKFESWGPGNRMCAKCVGG